MIELPLREIHAKVLLPPAALEAMKKEAGSAENLDAGIRHSLWKRGGQGFVRVTKLLLPAGTQVTWSIKQPYTDGVFTWE